MKRLALKMLIIVIMLSIFGVFTSCSHVDSIEEKTSTAINTTVVENDELIENNEIIKNEIQSIEDNYISNEGFVDENDVQPLIKEIIEFAESQSNNILFYKEGHRSVLIKFKNGLSYVYQPKVKDLKAVGSNLRVVSCQPFYTEFFFKKAPDEAAALLTKNKFVKVVFDDKDNINDKDVTIERIKSLKDSSFILWDGHGGYDEYSHSFISISVKFSEVEKKYHSDCKDDLFLESSNGNTLITAKFFEKYFDENDFKDAVIYLGTCDSAMDDYLANVFLSKGAKTVFGNTDVTKTDYDAKMVKSIFNYYSKGYSAVESLIKAQKENEKAHKNVVADVVLIGDAEYSLKKTEGKKFESENKSPSNVKLEDDWKSIASDYIFNLPQYADLSKVLTSDYLVFEFIDMDYDSIPEIFMYFISSGGGGMGCNAYAYWNGNSFVTKYIDDYSKSPCVPIFPYNDSKTNSISFVSGMLDENKFDEDISTGSYGSGWFWRNQWYQDRWSFDNKTLQLIETSKVDEVEDFDKLYNHSNYSIEEQEKALNNMREYNKMLHTRYSESISKYYYVAPSIKVNSVICDSFSEASYHGVISKNDAHNFIESYLQGKHGQIE